MHLVKDQKAETFTEPEPPWGPSPPRRASIPSASARSAISAANAYVRRVRGLRAERLRMTFMPLIHLGRGKNDALAGIVRRVVL